MGLIDDCKQYFGCDNLYEVLGVSREANASQIKSAYRKRSLVVHPDRAEEDRKRVATRAFQTLAKVHYILNDQQLRHSYDELGFVADEDGVESSADWQQYWRLLFPKITTKDINAFLDKYIGSDDEKSDLKAIYTRYGGDMDMIYECQIGFDEERTRRLITDMIDNNELPKYDAFLNESTNKREKRSKKIAKESKMAEREMKKSKNSDNCDDDLVNAIQSRAKGKFDDMIAGLEAKYANDTKSKQNTGKPKRKTNN